MTFTRPIRQRQPPHADILYIGSEHDNRGSQSPWLGNRRPEIDRTLFRTKYTSLGPRADLVELIRESSNREPERIQIWKETRSGRAEVNRLWTHAEARSDSGSKLPIEVMNICCIQMYWFVKRQNLHQPRPAKIFSCTVRNWVADDGIPIIVSYESSSDQVALLTAKKPWCNIQGFPAHVHLKGCYIHIRRDYAQQMRVGGNESDS